LLVAEVVPLILMVATIMLLVVLVDLVEAVAAVPQEILIQVDRVVQDITMEAMDLLEDPMVVLVVVPVVQILVLVGEEQQDGLMLEMDLAALVHQAS
jgi:hypothetical protein